MPPKKPTDPTFGRIEMVRTFQGRPTREIPIPLGVYNVGDPVLVGREEWFVEHGFAKWIADEPVVKKGLDDGDK